MIARMSATAASPPSDLLPEVRRDYLAYLAALGPLGLGTLLTLPILTRELGAQDLGVLALVEAVMTPAVTLGMMGMKFAYLYRHARASADEALALLKTATFITLGLSLLFGLLAAGLITALSWQAGALPPVEAPLAAASRACLVILTIISGNAAAMLMTQLRAQRAIRATAWASYAQMAVGFASCWWFLTGLGWGIDGFLLSQILGNAVATGITLAQIGLRTFSAATPAAGAGEARALLRYGWPLTLGLVVRYGMDSLSRIFLGLVVSLEAAGDWLMVSRVLALFEILVANPFFMAWGAHVHVALQRADRGEAITRVTRWCAALSLASAMVLMLAHQPLLRIMAGHWRPDLAWLCTLLLLAKWIPVVKSPLCAGINADGRTDWAWKNNLQALAVFAASAWPLGLWAGAEGIAGAMALAGAVSTWTLYRASRRAMAPV